MQILGDDNGFVCDRDLLKSNGCCPKRYSDDLKNKLLNCNFNY